MVYQPKPKRISQKLTNRQITRPTKDSAFCMSIAFESQKTSAQRQRKAVFVGHVNFSQCSENEDNHDFDEADDDEEDDGDEDDDEDEDDCELLSNGQT